MATNEETTVNLQHDITVNGKTFHAGQKVAVPKDQADDISRMDYEAAEQDRLLHVRRTSEVNAGSISAGGGAA